MGGDEDRWDIDAGLRGEDDRGMLEGMGRNMMQDRFSRIQTQHLGKSSKSCIAICCSHSQYERVWELVSRDR